MSSYVVKSNLLRIVVKYSQLGGRITLLPVAVMKNISFDVLLNTLTGICASRLILITFSFCHCLSAHSFWFRIRRCWNNHMMRRIRN